MEEFVQLRTAEALARVRAIADDVWPKTFREILSPEQIVYMMKMMYAPEVMEKELANGFLFVFDCIAACVVVFSCHDSIPF